MYTPRPALGTKRLCVACAVRFYDLGRTPARCPTCGAEQPPPRPRSAPLPRGASWGRRPGNAASLGAAPAPEPAEDAPLLDTPEAEDDAEPAPDDDDDDADDIAEIAPAEEEEPL